MDKTKLKAFLEGLYYVYARREIINPDPLYFLYNYKDVMDREIVGLIASSLAYGRVAQIMKSVERVLSYFGKSPREFLLNSHDDVILPEDFKHRFTTAADMNNLLKNISEVLREYGSVEGFLRECLKDSGGDLFGGLDQFSDRLSRGKVEESFSLVTAPRDGSACKRLFLYLKWMVRHDDVDPGGWGVLKASELIIPTDVHMHRIARQLGLTTRKNADLRTAIEITSGFREVCRADVCRYDFVLTRFGIKFLPLLPF